MSRNPLSFDAARGDDGAEMIQKGWYKDREAIIVQSDALRATLLPQDGAKMASLIDLESGKELLAVKSTEPYRVLTYDGNYVDAECSAFDDLFPTIDPYTPNCGAYQGIPYPDHGEWCRIPFAIRIENDQVVFSAKSQRFPMRYQKSVSVAPSGGISLRYSITNEGDEPFDFIWAGHVMLQGEDGMLLITPFEENAPTETVFVTKGYNPAALPRDTLMGFQAGKGAAYKFYYLDPMKKGFFAVRYSSGKELFFRFDETKLPYLGVWLNNGEFQGIYNLAPEPCTAPFDSPERAAQKGYESKIPAKSVFAFEIDISMKQKENENA